MSVWHKKKRISHQPVIFHFRKRGHLWVAIGQVDLRVHSGPINRFCKLGMMEPRQSSEIFMVEIKNQCLRLAIKTRTMFSNTAKHQQAFGEMPLLFWG